MSVNQSVSKSTKYVSEDTLFVVSRPDGVTISEAGQLCRVVVGICGRVISLRTDLADYTGLRPVKTGISMREIVIVKGSDHGWYRGRETHRL